MVAKMKGKHVDQRPSWDSNRVKFMEVIVRSKFARDPKLTKDLLDTGDQKIVEGRTGDKFWGGKANHLRNILMKVREEARGSRASTCQQVQESVIDETDGVKPRRKQNKGNTFEVTVMHGEDVSLFWRDVTEQLRDIIDRWCRQHGVDSGQIQFNLLEPAQIVDPDSHYADVHRRVCVCRLDDLDSLSVDASYNTKSSPPLQLEQLHSGLSLGFCKLVAYLTQRSEARKCRYPF